MSGILAREHKIHNGSFRAGRPGAGWVARDIIRRKPAAFVACDAAEPDGDEQVAALRL